MVGGIIVDYYVERSPVKFADMQVTFLAKGKEAQGGHCCVTAMVSEAVMEHIKIGDTIWWHNPDVYFQLFGEQDVPFLKIGPSGGGAKEFYKYKAKANKTKKAI